MKLIVKDLDEPNFVIDTEENQQAIKNALYAKQKFTHIEHKFGVKFIPKKDTILITDV